MGSEMCIRDRADNYLSTLEDGATLSQVTGVFNFSYGTYKIQIRDLADLGQELESIILMYRDHMLYTIIFQIHSTQRLRYVLKLVSRKMFN